jgi:DNA anti-recombination protein RmuC
MGPSSPDEGRTPVTAKLSRTFYEKFGDEATNELVEWLNAVDAAYRSDLREFNELNFGRFDSKLEERLSQSDARLEKRLTRFETRIEERLASFEKQVEGRLASFEKRLAGFEAQTAQRFVELDQKIETRTLSLRAEMGKEIAAAKTDMIKWMFVFWVGTVAMFFLARLA